MKKIKAGEYVRTDKGYIFKIDERKEMINLIEFFNVEYGNIVKHSKKIIYLVEVGDIVNGSKVLDRIFARTPALYLEQIGRIALEPTINRDIKTILTKEQLQANQYVVGG